MHENGQKGRLAVVLLGAFLVTAGCDTVRDVGYVRATEADRAGDYRRAAELYRFVSESESYDGRQAAQYRLAEMYMKGQGVERDPGQALTFYEQVAAGPQKSWQKLALYQLGYLTESGVPGYRSKDRAAAASYYERCAKFDDEHCGSALDRLLRHPDVYVSRHRDRFHHSEVAVAPAGMPYAYRSFKEGQRDKAFPIFLWHARNGNAEAQRNVAVYYRTGVVGDKNPDLYKAWTWLAARNGEAASQLELGLLYRKGELVPGSDAEARKWFSSAAKQGLAEAVNWLGVLRLHPLDKGVERNLPSAFAYFQRAADGGSVLAMTNLADMYLHGLGVEPDRDVAKDYYLAAAREGDVVARRRLFEKFNIAFDDSKATKEEVASIPGPRDPPEDTAPSAQPVRTASVPPAQSEPVTPSAVELYSRLSTSVMRILAMRKLKKGEEQDLAGGSAVAITPELAITNCHVIADMDYYGTRIGEKVSTLRLAAGDRARDVCILHSKVGLHPVTTTRSFDELKVGERVYAIGSPQGLQNTLSEGIISGLRRSDGIRYIQTSAPISQGSSGGGLFDEKGRLIGITTFAIKGIGNLNFAVAVDEALGVLSRVR